MIPTFRSLALLRAFTLLTVISLLVAPSHARTIRVPAEQPTIQAGIDAASQSDTVLVAPDTYSGPGNKNLLFRDLDIVVRSESGAELTIIDCEGDGRGFVLYGNLTSAAVVEGFTIRRGSGTGGGPAGGGAFLIYGCSPTVRACIFSENTAPAPGGVGGGGLACYLSSSLISDCVFERNTAVNPDFIVTGGGLAITDSSPMVTECHFSHNVVDGPGGEGGGIGIFPPANPDVSWCTFEGNEARLGGGMSTMEGTVNDCQFIENSASIGGGLSGMGTTISRCTFEDNDASSHGGGLEIAACEVRQCMILRNTAPEGGGLVIRSLVGTSTITECTFSENAAVEGGGIDLSTSTVITSSTFYRNASERGSGVYLRSTGTFSNFLQTIVAFGIDGEAFYCTGRPSVVQCCDVYANEGGDWVGCLEGLLGAAGNISEDPLFCDAPNGDLKLRTDSPCASANSPPGCGLIGAFPVGCGPTAIQPTTWGRIKTVRP